jgi:tetratricopeptide (TPR) repeat protein
MLETDLINCLLVLEWLLDKDELDTANRFFGSLSSFLITRGYWDAATRYCKGIVEGFGNRGKHYTESIVLLGALYQGQGRWNEAIECYRSELKAARESKDKELQANILSGLGKVYTAQRKWDEASKYLKESREMFQCLGDEAGEAIVLNTLGELHRQTGRLEEAVGCFESCREISERCNEKLAEADSLNNLAICYLDMEKHEDAAKCYKASLKIYRGLGDKPGQRNVLNNLGALYYEKADPDRAMQYYQDSLKIGREIGDRDGQQALLGNMALVYSTQGQWLKAAGACLESFQITVQIHYSVVIDLLKKIRDVSKNMLRAGEFAIPAQLVQRLSQVIQSTEAVDDEMRMALAICHGVFTIIGFMAMCECDRESDVYKEALELARTLDENTGAILNLKLVEWLKGCEA